MIKPILFVCLGYLFIIPMSNSEMLTESFEELVLLRVQLKSEIEAMTLERLVYRNRVKATFLKRHPEFSLIAAFEEFLDELTDFNVKMVARNVTKLVAEHNEMNIIGKEREEHGNILRHFGDYNEIERWMKRMVRENVRFVDLWNIGSTFKKKPIFVMKIGFPRRRKKAAFVTSGFHAREWLSVSSTLYIIRRLIKYGEYPGSRIYSLLNKFDFYILPVANPDGYQLTFANKTTRFWRKTLSNFGKNCIGSDPNRNFDIEFGTTGVSTDPCSDIYPGPRAFSESCTQSIKRFAERIKDQLVLYYDIHSFSQLFFVPFGYNASVKSSDDAELRRVAEISKAALERVNGRKYRLGTPGEILYDASGSAMDWMKKKLGVKYCFGIESFPDARSKIGFLAPPSEIEHSGKEISEAVITSAENIRT